MRRHEPFLILIIALAVLAPAVVRAADAEVRSDDRPWIGVWLGDAVDGGVQVARVVAGGPAAIAGVRSGDVIVEVDGVPVPSEERLGAVLGTRTAGDSVRLALIRQGDSRTVVVPTGSWAARVRRSAVPAPHAAPDGEGTDAAAPRTYLQWVVRPRFGVDVVTMTPELRQHYGAPRDAGVLVTTVESDGVAERAGLQVGDVLVEIGGRPVRTPIDANGALLAWHDGPQANLIVFRGGQKMQVALPADAAVPARDVERERTERLHRRLEAEAGRLERRLREIRRQIDELAESPD